MVDLTPADLANAGAFVAAVERELTGLVVTAGHGDTFVFYDPDQVTVPEQRFPFVTVVTGDRYDGASHLDRDDHTYRVNLAVSRRTYEHLLGPAPRQAAGYEVIETGADYTAVDVVLPHPFYAPLHWLCIVNPGQRTRAQLAQLVQSSYASAVRQYENRSHR